MDANREKRGVWLMSAGGLLLGPLGVFVEEAGVDPLTAVWFRCAFGLAALLAWLAWRGRFAELLLLPRRAAMLAVIGGLLMMVNWALFFAAIRHSSIALATVVFHVQPVWVMAWGMWRLGEPASPLRVGAMLAALGGLALATGLFDSHAWASGSAMLGIVCAIGGSISYAAVTRIAKEQRESPCVLAAWQCAVGALVLAPWPIVHGWPVAASLGWLAGLGVLHTALAYVLVFGGMQRLSASRIALLQFVYPLTAIAVDALVYGRTLSPLQSAGVFAMGAALWAARRPMPDRAAGARVQARG